MDSDDHIASESAATHPQAADPQATELHVSEPQAPGADAAVELDVGEQAGVGADDAKTLLDNLEPFLADPNSHEAAAIEAILMVADQPVTPQLLGELLEMRPSRIEALCDALASSYNELGKGFVLARVAGGYRFQSSPDYAQYVERFILDGQAARMSAAAMETLAIVAYKQPISRAQVAAIRGVNVDGVMRTLVQRGYVAEIAIDPGPGQAALFGTTKLFLESLGLDKISDLTPLGDLVPGADVMDALEASLRIDDESGRPIRGPVVRGDSALRLDSGE